MGEAEAWMAGIFSVEEARRASLARAAESAAPTKAGSADCEFVAPTKADAGLSTAHAVACSGRDDGAFGVGSDSGTGMARRAVRSSVTQGSAGLGASDLKVVCLRFELAVWRA